ncbi:PH, RCC1 and FYVE domains-containing protein 1 [Cornus florida]|uniref:PH, RCC1 and FYVE domains-containing protein 1 n=1 Tax=Cornus florida TaxID=4283 RepID=UPI0028A0773B|nr:PH, RCC1 and FYVE domains-containing protein 1 [Cornus florida]
MEIVGSWFNILRRFFHDGLLEILFLCFSTKLHVKFFFYGEPLDIVLSSLRGLVFSKWVLCYARDILDIAAGMADLQRSSLGERNVEQAITALKRGSYLLKYGRRGKPKFCPFHLSNDETVLIWYAGKKEKQLRLSHISRIIPGQRTAIFQRYPQPEKEYQSFSLIYGHRSLDLICKDKEEAEIWFVALRALISRGNCQRWRNEASDSVSLDSSSAFTQRNSSSIVSNSSSEINHKDPGSIQTIPVPFENLPQKRLGRAFSDVISSNAAMLCFPQTDFIANPLFSLSSGGVDEINGRSSADTFRASFSSAVSSSSQGSSLEDFDALGDIFIWGEGTGDGYLGGGVNRVGKSSADRIDALSPKALESIIVLDAQNIACGSKHAVLVTKQGEIYSWGEESDGRLGHGVAADVSNPKLIKALSGLNIESVECGDFHTCAVTRSGDLYTWGGLLGHGSEVNCWTPKNVSRQIKGLHVSSISCGPWHTAAVTSVGQLFTFGDGTFGVLGHGDRSGTTMPREVETLKGRRTVRVSCGVWHTAAIVELTTAPSSSGNPSIGKLFTWGDGGKGQLGHGDKEPRLVPSCVAVLDDTNFCQVACGHYITVALTTSGRVYTMGSADYGQLGVPGSAGKLPKCIEGKIRKNFIEEIACGSHHVAALSSRYEVYTWGKGENGQLGHGDNDDRNTPTLVQALKDKRVKSVACGTNFTAAICLHKRVCDADNFVCSGCQNPFSFRRKRHNCYNCGLVFCKTCSSRKSLKASLAPNMNKPYRVCDACFNKLKKATESGLTYRLPEVPHGNKNCSAGEVKERETLDHKSHSLLSRLSSFDSFRRPDTQFSKQNKTLDSNSSHISLLQNGSLQRRSSYTSITSTIENSQRISTLVPGSDPDSRAACPISTKSSPPCLISHKVAFAELACNEVILNDSTNPDDSVTSEISILRAQVEDLTRKSQLLEAEIERTRRQLKEATDLARREVEKNKAAKEVIESLSWQVRKLYSSKRLSLCDLYFHQQYSSNFSSYLVVILFSVVWNFIVAARS